MADRQWLANTNFMHERKPTAPARGLVIEDPLAIELLASGWALVDLVGKIEERLSAVFREVVKRAPDYPSTRWEALYAAWREVPDRLERLQTAAKVAAARLQNEFDDKGRDR